MNLVYVKKINNDESLTGLVNVSVNPPFVFCYCDEHNANFILKAIEKSNRIEEIISKVSLSNVSITSFGDGFETAIKNIRNELNNLNSIK